MLNYSTHASRIAPSWVGRCLRPRCILATRVRASRDKGLQKADAMFTGIPVTKLAFSMAFQLPLFLKMGRTEPGGPYLPYCTPSRLVVYGDHRNATPVQRGRQLGEKDTLKHSFERLCRLNVYNLTSVGAGYHIAIDMQDFDAVCSDTEASVPPARIRDDGFIGHNDVTETAVDGSDHSHTLTSQNFVAATHSRCPILEMNTSCSRA